MRKVNFVIVTCKSMCESQRIKFSFGILSESWSRNLVSDLVLIIFDICPNSLPAKLFYLTLVLTVTDNLHTKVVQTVGFC